MDAETDPPSERGERTPPKGLLPGTRVGNVVVERELGRGGFAVVHLARDLLVDRLVALKVIERPVTSDAERARRTVLAEARAVAALSGPHVVTLYGVHELPEGRIAFEMEYLDGGSLEDRLAGGALGAEQTVRFLTGILGALRVAHAHGVLHRDVKPANVLLSADGAVKLADFGIARIRGEESFRTDSHGAVAGSPWYMAPEAFLGEAPSPQSDLWSVGVIAYQLLTGRIPFDAPDLPTLFTAVQNAPVPRLPGTVPESLSRLISGCLAKRRDDRPSGAEELLRLLDAPHPRDTAGAAAERAGQAPARPGLIARGAEVAAVLEDLDRAASGESAVVLVTGEEGAGKSALLAEVAGRARARGFAWIDAAASPVDGVVASVLVAVRDRLARMERRPRADDTGEASITRLLGAGGPSIERRDQALWALDHALRALADESPVVLAVDDAHHLRDPDAEFLASLARRLGACRFALVAASRDGDGSAAGALAALPGARRVSIGGLPREHLYTWIERSAGAEVAPVVAARISERSDGNPTVAAEMLRDLESAGAVVRRGGRIDATPGWDAHPLPSRLRDVYESRLRHLADDDRHLLEAAAVDGREFDGRALADALGLPLLDVLRTLQRLCRAHLLHPAATGYRFASPVIHAVLVESLSPEIRTQFHRALVAALRTRADEVDPERMARHLDGSGDRAGAEEFFARAAERAGDTLQPERSLALAERAGLLREDVPGERLLRHAELVLRLAANAGDAAKFGVAEGLRSRLRAAAESRGDADLVLKIDVWSELLRIVGRGTADVDVGLLERATKFEDGIVPCDAWRALGLLAKRRGDLDDAERAFQACLRIARDGGYEHLYAMALDQLGSVARRRGRFDEAIGLYSRAAALAERIGLRKSAATSLFNRAAAALQSGTLDGVDAVLERSLHLFELDDNAQGAAHVRATLAEVLFALGDLAGAERAARRAAESLRTFGHPPGLALAENCLGELLAFRGRIDEALLVLGSAAASARKAGDRALEATVASNECLAHCFAGRAGDAARRADETMAIAAGGTQDCTEILVRIGIAGFLGLPAETISAARSLAGRAPDDSRTRAMRAILDGAAAFLAEDGRPEVLRAASAALREPEIAVRRSVFGPLSDWVGAIALRRDGDPIAARAAVEPAIRSLNDAGLFALERVVSDSAGRPAPGRHRSDRG